MSGSMEGGADGDPRRKEEGRREGDWVDAEVLPERPKAMWALGEGGLSWEQAERLLHKAITL